NNIEEVEIGVDITNSGKVYGKEVVQLYIRDKVASLVRPVKELKGFELIELNAGEAKTVRFKLTKKELGFYNNKGEYLVEPGEFDVFVGGSSYTELKSKFTLE
ncbi:MAG: fibronectin type III-like domain-contianing protein, partial [Winogradskyella sp.]|nr:fibronectin type III-like domain-contianing protein [Winogradskyella sp.]